MQQSDTFGDLLQRPVRGSSPCAWTQGYGSRAEAVFMRFLLVVLMGAGVKLIVTAWDSRAAGLMAHDRDSMEAAPRPASAEFG